MKGINKVVILHGSAGLSVSHWYIWLKEQIEKIGIKVIIPEMPLGDDLNKESWLEVVRESVGELDGNSIIIGHSLGAALMLSYLPELENKVGRAYFIAGFGSKFYTDDSEEDEKCNVFVDSVSWKKVRGAVRKINVLFSDNDDAVPIEKGIEMGKNLQANVKIISGANHFCTEDGYGEFPELLEMLLDDIYVGYEDFAKVDMRIGQIMSVKLVPDADRLLCCEVDVGEDAPRIIVSGIRNYLEDVQEIVGKKVLYVVNLAPRVIKGIESQGMLMAVGDEETDFSFLIPENNVEPGSRIR